MELDGTGERTGETVLVVSMDDAALVAVVVNVIKVVAVMVDVAKVVAVLELEFELYMV